MKTFSLSAISARLFLFGTVFLLPVLFIPIAGLSISFVKMAVVSTIVTIGCAAFLINALRKGEVAVPRTRVYGAAILLFVVMLIAGVLSPVMRVSLFGDGYEVVTVVGVCTMLLLFFLSSVFLGKKNMMRDVYRFLSVSGIVVIAYQIANLITLRLGSNILSFNMFTTPVGTPVGEWYDLGLFSGLLVILSMITTALFVKDKRTVLLINISASMAIVMTVLVNFSLVWWLLAVFSLLALVFSMSFGKSLHGEGDETRQHAIPVMPIIVLVISVFFLLPGGLGAALISKTGLDYTNVRPSLTGTTNVALSTWGGDVRSAIVGSGPNRFVQSWLLHKPKEINGTVAWDTNFVSGFGTIPTFAVTTGIIGLIAWLLFFGTFFVVALKGIGKVERTSAELFPIVSVFALALYTWIVAFVYTPGVVMFSFAFLFSGAAIALLARANILPTFSFSFMRDPRIGFFSVLILVVLLIGTVVGGYGVISRTIAAIEFGSGVIAMERDNNATVSAEHLLSAINLYETDTYDRTLASVFTSRLYQISVGEDPNVARAQFQEVLGNAIAAAQKAVAYDPSSYLNNSTLGDVYATVASIGVEGAYTNAVSAYALAREHNPYNPALYLSLARLEIGQKNIQAARDNINEAIVLKNDYADAIFLLSQIEAGEGNMKQAIALSEQTALLAPNDVGALFQLGLLYYREGEYASAVSPLERAIKLSPDYANAQYFLGLSYDGLNRKEDAIRVFEQISKNNQGNAELTSIISNLKSGKSALNGLETPLEDREQAPIEE